MGDFRAKLQQRTKQLMRRVSSSNEETPGASKSHSTSIPPRTQDASTSTESYTPINPMKPINSPSSPSVPHDQQSPFAKSPSEDLSVAKTRAEGGVDVVPSSSTNPRPTPQDFHVDPIDSSPKTSTASPQVIRRDTVESKDHQPGYLSVPSVPSPAITVVSGGRLPQLRELTLGSPTPGSDPDSDPPPAEQTSTAQNPRRKKLQFVSSSESSLKSKSAARILAEAPEQLLRKQSLVSSSNAHFIKTLLEDESAIANPDEQQRYITAMTKELHRKIWVKRPGASPTLVQIRENDLMDGVREMILKKYANSLGRYFDAPDITLRIVARDDPSLEQTLGPDEEICRTLDTYYPGGQTVDEALIIDVPHRRTPRQSPRPTQIVYYDDQSRPFEHGGDYFPPMPPNVPSPAAITSTSHESRHSRDLSLSQTHSNHSHSHSLGHSSFDQTRSMTVLSTGQVPPLPSPGGTRRSHLTRPGRPANVRQPTASPTALANPHRSSRPHDSGDLAPAPAIISTPPTEHPPTAAQPTSRPTTPRVSSPRPKGRRRMRLRPDGTNSAATTPAPMSLSIPTIETSVPPINVLIVEDNHINLKLLEQFIRRLKVRWASAQNGREAVNKWRTGGFHLVLMDIQLPIMSGLEATKEIRRLERVNGIGVLANSTPTPGEEKSVSEGGLGNVVPTSLLGEDKDKAVSGSGEMGRKLKEGDKLVDRSLFKSPVIIVALTASNLQSDRHEALAAGCNDFLTKPVNFVWLERKVKEWGCMQALIDFDGWRKWKDFSQNDEGAEKKKEEK